MKRLFSFELARVVRGRLLLALGIVFLLLIGTSIFFAPTIEGLYHYGYGDATIMALFNSFAQFSMISLGSIYVYAFSRDFQNGGYDFYPQIGIAPARALLARALVLLALSWLGVALVFVAVILLGGGSDFPIVAFAAASSLLSVAFVLVLACAMALCLRNPMFGVLAIFILFVIGGSINYNFYGLAFQTDTSSFSTFVMGHLLGHSNLSSQIASLPLDFSQYGVAIALFLSALWITVFVIVSFIMIKRLSRVNRHWRLRD